MDLSFSSEVRLIDHAQYGTYSANFDDGESGSLRLMRPALTASRIRLDTWVRFRSCIFKRSRKLVFVMALLDRYFSTAC